MTAAGQQVTKVSVDYSQYWVTAGPDIEPGEDIVPGLLLGLGRQGVAIITGLESGDVTVSAHALPNPPAELDTGWDVVAEVDLECPGGTITVCDWGGPGHDELGDLTPTGPGRYRLRVHARHREQASPLRPTEAHHLLIWPTAEPAPPQLLTVMDDYGRVFSGEEMPETPPLDSLDLAAAASVKELAALVNQPNPPDLSGDLTTVHAQAIVAATPRKVWNQVSTPWLWLGNQGGNDPANFDFRLLDDPWMEVRGAFIAEDPTTHLAFTWSWTTVRWATVATSEPYAIRHDLTTGHITTLTTAAQGSDALPSWLLPAQPTTVHIRLARQGKGTTAVEVAHHDLPVELTGATQTFWEWALRELRNRLSNAPFYGHPWER